MSRDFFAGRPPVKGSFLDFLRISEPFHGVALEEQTDGVQRVERELCFVARIAEQEMLQRATRVEKQEERELFLTPKGSDLMARLRIRRSTVDGTTEDILTFKTRGNGEKFPKESSVVAPEGLFDLFSILPGAKANEKTRYVFPTASPNGEVWEVDVYPNADGTQAAWVKIDFEFKGESTTALPEFPAGLTDVMDTKTTDPKDRAFIDDLFQTVFFRNTK